MEMNVRDDQKLVEIWLTNAEKIDPVLREGLKEIYAKYKTKKYMVAVFESGKGDLYENTRDLLLFNRRRSAEKAVQQAKKRNRQISRRIKKHLWLSNRSWARDVHSFGILHSWGALAGKSCSAQASSIWLIAGAFRRTQSK